MSKMRCQCGYTISDTVCPCPTEAAVVGDIAYELLDRDFTKDVADFLCAIQNGNRDLWIAQRFNAVYPKNLPDSDVISDLLSYHYSTHSLRLSECEACGRLWIQQAPDENGYRSFAPDEGAYGRHLMVVGKVKCETDNATNNPMDRSGGSAAT